MSNHELQKAESSDLQKQSEKPNKLIGNWIINQQEYQIAQSMTQKKIGKFNREEMGNIVDILAQWRLLLGVTSDATQEELIFITQFLYDNYKHLTLSDLKMAKDWSITSKIDVGFVTQKTFSSYYIARCLNAYEEEKRRIINEINERKDRYEAKKALENPMRISPEEEAKSFKDYLLTLYKSYSEDREFYDLADMVYNWGKSVGLINPTNKEVSDALIYATERLREYKQSENRLIASKNIDTMDDETRKKKFARVFVITNMFRKHPVSELIQKINIEYFKK